MILKKCIICGRQFEGRPNSTLCSGACRIEYKRRYMEKYRKENREKLAEDKRKWYCQNKGIPFYRKKETKPKEPTKVEKPAPIITEKNPKEFYIANESKIICKNSTWGRKYLRRDRLEQIVFLSTELSKLSIEKLSYGELSAIRTYDKYYYLKLLKAVVDAKEASA